MKETTKKYVAFGIVCLFGMGIGFSLGFYSAVSFILDKGLQFLSNQGVDFSLTASQIAQLVISYQRIIEQGSGSTYVFNNTK